MSNVIELYTDGSCAPSNPGPGGIGYVIRYSESDESNDVTMKEIEGSQGYRLSTNNRMEIRATIQAIEDIILYLNGEKFKDLSQINIFTDSKYLCDAVNQKWIDRWKNNNWITAYHTPVKNKDLWELLLKIFDKLSARNINYQINHIPGHQGHPYNERADQLAAAATKETDKVIVDEGYERAN